MIHVKGFVSIATANFRNAGIRIAVITPATTEKKRIIFCEFRPIQSEKLLRRSISHLIAGDTERMIFALRSSIVI